MQQENVDEIVDKLVEQEPEELEQPFPHRVVPQKKKWKHATELRTRGEPWVAKVYAARTAFPEELFKELDLHHEGDEPGFLGWIGGTLSGGRENEEGRQLHKTLFVEEVQSDVIQRTVYYTSKERYTRTVKRRLAKTSVEWGQLFQEYDKAQEALLKLELQPSDVDAGDLLNMKLAAEERLEMLMARMTAQQKDLGKDPKLYPQFATIRSKVENAFKKWIPAFFNAALRFAQKEETTFFAILSARKLRTVWQGHDRYTPGGTADIYERVYDETARKWGMKREGDWWVGLTAGLAPLPYGKGPREQVEELENPEHWREHLDTFVRVFSRHESIDLDEFPPESYGRKEAFGYIFGLWLDEMPVELKADETWREEVRGYIKEKWQVEVDFGGDPLGYNYVAAEDPEPGNLGHGAPDTLPSGGMSDEELDRLFHGERTREQ